MSVSSSWIHGNALVVESPLYIHPDGRIIGRLIVDHFGRGAQITVEGTPSSSWIHLPIPTINDSFSLLERFNLVRVSLLFECSDAFIEGVHIYDGNEKIAEFNNPPLEGTFLTKGVRNTFELKKPHRMKSGVGLSFLFTPRALIGVGSGGLPPHGTLIVAAAGAEFETRSILLSVVGEIAFKLRP